MGERSPRSLNADAMLLIAAALSDSQMQELYEAAREMDIDTLIEIHNLQELDRVMNLSPSLIGINNRNLNDFSVDLETTFRLKQQIPAAIPVVSESGIRSRNDLERLHQENITAALIGETLMREKDPAAMLQELMGRK